MEDDTAAEQNELCLMGCVRTVCSRTDNMEEFIQKKKKVLQVENCIL